MNIKALLLLTPLALIYGCKGAPTGAPEPTDSPQEDVITQPKDDIPPGLETSVHWYTKDLFEQPSLNKVTIEGGPSITASSIGDSVDFDGDGDRLLVQHNPLFGAKEFTVEAIIFPNDVHPNNKEPRFLHIESSDTTDRRITMELRLNENNQWYFDGYIKSEKSKYTLVDKNLVHPTNQWAHTAITYKDRTFTSYVNGKKELSAQVDYLPIAENAATSIGARMNQIHWFNGQIHSVTTTPIALKPEDFKTLDLVLKGN